MKPKGLFLIIFFSLLIFFNCAAFAQQPMHKRISFKAGYIFHTKNDINSIPYGSGSLGYTSRTTFSNGLILGLETYHMVRPSNELVIGLQYASIKREFVSSSDSNSNGIFDANETTSINSTVNWFHIPITYKIKFFRDMQRGKEAYFGFGFSRIFTNTNNAGTFWMQSFHVKGGYAFSKKLGLDVEGLVVDNEFAPLSIFWRYQF